MTEKNISETQHYQLTYDNENRLIQIELVDTSIPTTTIVGEYIYDGDGKRVRVVVNGEWTDYFGNYFEATEEEVTKYYYSGNQRIAWRVNDSLYFGLSDHLGSISVVVNEGGEIVGKVLYKAWGESRYASGSLNTEYKYTGQREAEAGLYFYNARWYDPQLGRFVQTDTVIPEMGNPLAWDRFVYGNNNPIKYIDPSGHDIWDTVEQFYAGFFAEVIRTIAWYSPQVQEELKVKPSDSSAMLAGRITANVSLIAIGTGLFEGGVNIAFGGSVAGCLTTACAISPVAVITGAGVGAVGATVAVLGMVSLGGNLAIVSDRNGSNNTNKIHGNSLDSQKETFLYELVDLNGKHIKYGITSDPIHRYSKKFMADKKMIIIDHGSRRDMYNIESGLIEKNPPGPFQHNKH